MTVANSMTAMLGEAVGGLSSLNNSELVAALFIMLLGIVLGVGVTCTFLVVHFVRKGRRLSQAALARPDLLRRERRLRPPVFNLPPRWIAIKSSSPKTVLAALGLHNPTPCSWEEGLNSTNEHKLFISPPVRGWILVMGSHLPDPGDDVDRCFQFVVELSRKLGQVQFFSVNRAVNHHSWVLADMGSVQRAYAWGGRTLWNQGRKTRAEFDLGLKCFDYGEGEDRVEYGRIDPAAANTERLPLLAARWSIDPTSIDTRTLKENQGIAGRLSRSAAP